MIRIQNIYYMLAYAFQVLNEQGYKKIATEEFKNTADLFAAILSRGISTQIKRGLGKAYIEQVEPLSSLRGKINITESMKTLTWMKKQMVCEYDDFSVNSYLNQIIKSTVELLLRADISKSRKKELKNLMLYFSEVSTIDLHTTNWNVRYDRNNQTYRMLISVCYLVVHGLLQTQTNGSTKLMDFMDEQRMHKLYEKFILEYYRREYPQLTVNPEQIQWQIDDDMREMLPIMQSDITLSKDGTADCGLTGRKIVCDQYGGYCAVGGGAFSGKDPSKVDRSASYMARWIACHLLEIHDLKWCEVQLGYAIGVAQPISVCVRNDKGLDLSNEVRENYPLTPRGIINKLCLAEKDYEKLAEGCHYREALL